MYTLKELEARGVPPDRLEVRRIRREKRVSTYELAVMTGIDQQAICNFELGTPWAAAHRRRLLLALQSVPSRDYAAEMRAWREDRGLTVAQAARLLGANWSTWKTAEQRGYKYSPRKGLRERLDALLASDRESAA